MTKRPYISFKAFFLIWAEMQGWKAPVFHIRICDWLEKPGRRKVLKVFRGGAKSTILGVYQAWKLRSDPKWRLLDRSCDDDTAYKLSADTRKVIMLHPLCKGMLRAKKVGVERFSVRGNPDERNASVTAYGILSNATSSRADEIINDDPEVPKNIRTPDTRQSLRERLNEEIHILTPGGNILYVGTDHTHDSVYDEKIKNGYESLIIPLFQHYKRYECDGRMNTFSFDFPVKDRDDFYVMSGIGRAAKVYGPEEYDLTLTESGGTVRFKHVPTEGTIIDIATGNPWQERFDRAEVEFKRKECLTLNAWDSQYLLQAKPVHEIRLNPDRLVVYDEMPVIRIVNRAVAIMLKNTPLTTCRAYWDCSLGKPDSDDSTFSVIFGNEAGHLFWQALDVLEGEVYDQCKRVVDRVMEFQLPAVLVEVNGPGGFLPAILRKAFKEKGVSCVVIEKYVKENKSKRILDGFEPPLSGQFLHVHKTVLESGLAEQMRDWVPGKVNQPDDLLDSGAGCIKNLPVKIGKVVKLVEPAAGYHGFRPHQGSYEVKVEY